MAHHKRKLRFIASIDTQAYLDLACHVEVSEVYRVGCFRRPTKLVLNCPSSYGRAAYTTQKICTDINTINGSGAFDNNEHRPKGQLSALLPGLASKDTSQFWSPTRL